MKHEVLILEHIQKKLDGQHVLTDISLHLFAGEFMGVMIQDPNAKHLLLELLNGVRSFDKGFLIIDGMTFCPGSLFHGQDAGIVQISQHSTLIDTMSLAQNFYLTHQDFYRLGLFNKRKMIRALKQVLCEFGLERLDPTFRPNLLSRADQYLLEIIRATAFGASILLLDDIIIEHSLPETRELVRVLTQLKEKGISILYFTNKYNYLFPYFDSVTIIRSGLTTNIIRPCTLSREQLFLYFNSQHITRFPNGEFSPVKPNVLLLAEQISVPNHPYIQNFSFSIHKGECLGIWDADWNYGAVLGSTLFGGSPYRGRYTLDDKPILIRSASEAVKQGIALIALSETVANYYPPLDIYENVTMLVHKELCNPLGFINKQLQAYITRYSLGLIQADNLLDQYPLHNALGSIDSCTQMKIITAKWLCIHPKLMIFIHPYTIFDDLTIQEFGNTISCLSKLGISVLILSMNKEYLDLMCNRIITLPYSP